MLLGCRDAEVMVEAMEVVAVADVVVAVAEEVVPAVVAGMIIGAQLRRRFKIRMFTVEIIPQPSGLP